MHRFLLRSLTLMVVLVFAGIIPVPAEATGLTVELDLAPSSEAAGIYEVTAQIQDAESGEVLSVPTLAFPKGEDPASVTSSTPTGGSLEFTIAISPDGTTVVYAVERQEGGEVVASQKATIRLSPRGE